MSKFDLVPCAEPRVISALYDCCFEEGWSADSIAKTLAMPGVFCLVGGEGEEVMGFILFRAAGGESEVLSMGVTPEHRRKGLGHELLSMALSRLSAMEVEEIFLEVADDNPTAQAFYKKLNFCKVGTRRRYYKRKSGNKVDALILKRLLCG